MQFNHKLANWCLLHGEPLVCLAPAGYEVESIHEAADPVDAVRKAEGIFIGEELLCPLLLSCSFIELYLTAASLGRR